MALVFMEKGGHCHVSDEDYEAVSAFRWREKRLHPSEHLTAWTVRIRNDRRFDLFLHRLVAVRMDPSLAERKFAVKPKDGDYLNCRRDNLEVTIHRPDRYPSPKPGGCVLPGKRRSRPVASADDGDLARLWNPGKHLPTKRKFKSRPGARGDGPPGREVGGDPR